MKKTLVLGTFLFVSQAFGNVCFNADEAEIPKIEGIKIAKEICVESASSDMLPFGYASLATNMVVDGEVKSVESSISSGVKVQGGYKIKTKLMSETISANEVCGELKNYTVYADMIIDNEGELIAVEKISATAIDTNDYCHDAAVRFDYK